MEIQKFTVQKFLDSLRDRAQQRYYSQVYQREFPIYGGDLLAKIEPINKDEVNILLPRFEATINTIQTNFQEHPYQFGPEEYFIFRYRLKTHETNGRNLHIRFRTNSDDKMIDNFLEFLQESSILRYCCKQSTLELPLEEPLAQAYKSAVESNLWLIDNPQQMLVYMKKGRRKKWIEDKLLNLFDALGQMKKTGYNLNQVAEKIKDIQIPSENSDNDMLWNFVLKRLF